MLKRRGWLNARFHVSVSRAACQKNKEDAQKLQQNMSLLHITWNTASLGWLVPGSMSSWMAGAKKGTVERMHIPHSIFFASCSMLTCLGLLAPRKVGGYCTLFTKTPSSAPLLFSDHLSLSALLNSRNSLQQLSIFFHLFPPQLNSFHLFPAFFELFSTTLTSAHLFSTLLNSSKLFSPLSTFSTLPISSHLRSTHLTSFSAHLNSSHLLSTPTLLTSFRRDISHRENYYTQKFLHTEAFAQRCFTHKSFYTEAFTHSRPLHRETFTHSKLLHRETFTQSKLVRREMSSQRSIYTEQVFAQRSFYTEKFLYTHRNFYTEQTFP